MQDVLKKYKDPHIYTAFIKYSSLISIHDQHMSTIVSYTIQNVRMHQNVTGTTWESCLILFFAPHLRGPTNCCIYLRSHNILGASYLGELLLYCDRRCFFVWRVILYLFFVKIFRRQWATTNAIKDDRRRMKEIDRLLDEIPTANKRNIEFLFKFLAQLTVEEVEILTIHLFPGKRHLVDLTSKNYFEKHNLIFSLSSTSCV